MPPIGFVPVPYHRTIKAAAYAGKSIGDLRRVLEYAILEYPIEKDDNTIKRLHLSLRSAARNLNPDFEFSDEDCVDHEIDAMYHHMVAGGRRGLSEKADFVCKVLIDCRDLMLRQMVDTLLFIGEFDPAIIEERIYTNTVVPTTIWTAQEIGFYRDYFWDTTVMGNCDWQRYRSWFRTMRGIDKPAPKLKHVGEFHPANDRASLLLRARLNSGISDSAMLSQAKDIIHWCLTKERNNGDADRIARLSAALNKTINTSVKDLGDSESRQKFQSAIDRILTPLDGSAGLVHMISRDDLPQGSEVGDRAKDDQLEEVLNGKYDVDHSEDSSEGDLNVIQA